MTKIRVLPEELANKIAAGEVVERPASAVKELVENAIDAEARQVAVEIHGKGCRTIRVVDNGTGMEEDDVLLALERHATSKIISDADLAAIHTLGFRGEALPSLAAVSRFELRSRTRESNEGTYIRIEAGVVKEVNQCGCPPGTQLWIRDLFFNQPARRKFLKKERTEYGHVVGTLTRQALARPEIHFSLRYRNHRNHEWPAASDLQHRLAQIFPRRLTQSWVACSLRQGQVKLRGYLTPPELRRSDSRMLFFFVNGRSVQDRPLKMALLDGYRTLLPKGQFPMGVLFLDLPAGMVDVNVHPTKAEVRFQDPNSLCQAVTRAVRSALVDMEKLRWKRPLADTRRLQPSTTPVQHRLTPMTGKEQQIAEPRLAPYGRLETTRLELPKSKEETSIDERKREGFRTRFGELAVIGQLHQAYILCEAPDGLIIIDQHAAHERIFFEAFSRETAEGQLDSQGLMVPETIEFSAQEADWLEDALPLLVRLGFRLEPFGSHTFVVREVPAVALPEEPLELVRSLVAMGSGNASVPAPEEALQSLLQSMACRMAIKAGQRLGREEMVSLLRQLDSLDHCSTCPHGRPLWWKITVGEVERMFGRA